MERSEPVGAGDVSDGGIIKSSGKVTSYDT